MARQAFGVGKFRFLDRYEIHVGREGGRFFYEIEDVETLAMVDVKDGLTEGELLEAVGCALDPFQLLEFQRLVESL